MTQIQATGTSEAFYRAERATVEAHVSIVSKDRSRSIARAAALHNRVAARGAELRASGDATFHSADAPTTWVRKSYAEGNDSRVIIEHVTSSVVQIKLSNLDLVADLVAELSESGAQTYVSWSLTDASLREHERRARKAAVGVAREIADDYADALGEKVVRVVSVSDTQQSFMHMRAVGQAGDNFISGSPAEVTVEEITVSASVQGVFESTT